ncbi:MAG: PilX N-terminal domain-containing pilus assembly protein [Betaproteobacteria bacterium]
MKTRRGVALMLALWLIVILSLVAARVSTSARSSTSIAANLRARTSGKYAAESGIVVGAQAVRTRLSVLTDAKVRSSYLNSLEPNGAHGGERALGDARFAIVYVDVSSRLDVNNSSRAQLARLFSFFTGPVDAARAADAIRTRIGADDILPGERSRFGAPRTDIVYPSLPAPRPLRSLEELRTIDGVSEALAFAAAPYLTVDGDGKINRAAASDTVLAAAAGSLVDEPSRLMIVSRGWVPGQPLTHEIRAVYAVDGNRLLLVRWEERDL